MRTLGKPMVEIDIVAKLLNCLSLALLALSNVDEKTPDVINEAFIEELRINLSHSTTETGREKGKTTCYSISYYTKKNEYSVIKAFCPQLSHLLTFGMVGTRRASKHGEAKPIND